MAGRHSLPSQTIRLSSIYLVDYGYLTKHDGPIGPLAEGPSSTMRITALPAGFHKPTTK